eukprot:CAMPEP_0205799828 /NCGR_PEP_ID=MMETSP0205-20121125/1247_1 /ASSEMBLY_ACC=CAM_ASM_000278 /TAXON_ID=36767 /ORGANISM="Euplotes focardii, Strain TN1" /LENGTH=90 /DNA_ID=CAMNT_0053061827 /DNA_START=219 /DNA_END=491 /DNA_ORIENTATION=-
MTLKSIFEKPNNEEMETDASTDICDEFETTKCKFSRGTILTKRNAKSQNRKTMKTTSSKMMFLLQEKVQKKPSILAKRIFDNKAILISKY